MTAMDYLLLETEETLRPNTPEDTARYVADGKEYAAAAKAILAVKRNVLTGRETEACENAVNGDSYNASLIDSLRIQFSREISALL